MILWIAFATAVALALSFSPAPAWLDRLLFSPRGWVKAAYVIGFVALRGGARDRRGAALLAGARAAFVLTASRRRAAGAWLNKRARRMRGLRGASVAGFGLLAALRGERESARLLLHGVERLDASDCPTRAYELAREWLAADAASAGRWDEVVHVAARAPHQTLATVFLGLVGARLLGDRVYASDGALRRAWQLAPGRRATRPLLELALADSRPPPRRLPSPPSPAGRGDTRLARAIARYVELRASEVVEEGAWREHVAEWEAELADAGRGAGPHQRAQALRLQLRDPMAALQRSVEDALTELIESNRVAIGRSVEEAGLIGRLARGRRSALLAALELHVVRLRKQLDDELALDPLDGLRSFLALADAYESQVRGAGLEIRRTAFAATCEVVARLADWLDDDRRERALARALRRWLLEESRLAGTPQTYARAAAKLTRR